MITAGGILKAQHGRTRKRMAVSHSCTAPTSAFTLVELLVVIAIVAILAGLVLGVAGVAAETGREAKTKQMITRLHTLVMEHYDTFRDKRVDVTGADTGLALAQKRLLASRERMKMEMPDRWSDFLVYDLNSGLPAVGDLGSPTNLTEVPPLAQAYRATYARLLNQSSSITVENLVQNEGAECLYMIVMYATGDGESRGLFKETDFGDTDGDGAPEILDGWGRPIQFLRWAPGYRSELQLSHPQLAEIFEDFGADAVNAAINGGTGTTGDHDPLDLFRVDMFVADDIESRDREDAGQAKFVVDSDDNTARGFRLVPLIYSGGRDEDNDIETGRLFTAVTSAVDPYLVFGDDNSQSLGAPNNDTDGNNSVDNITNHLIQSE